MKLSNEPEGKIGSEEKKFWADDGSQAEINYFLKNGKISTGSAEFAKVAAESNVAW